MTTESKPKAPPFYMFLWGCWIGSFIGGIIVQNIDKGKLLALTERVEKLEQTK